MVALLLSSEGLFCGPSASAGHILLVRKKNAMQLVLSCMMLQHACLELSQEVFLPGRGGLKTMILSAISFRSFAGSGVATGVPEMRHISGQC